MATKKKLVLYTFPPVPNSYSFTPFGLKVESFLRINKIPYEIVYTSAFGKNATIPYARIFDGDEVDLHSEKFEEKSDSNEIIRFLLESPEFDTSPCEENLTSEQKAISHSCLRMLEEHTTQTAFYYRYFFHMLEFCEATQLKDRAFMTEESKLGRLIFYFFKKGVKYGTGQKAKYRGFTRYRSPEIVWTMACEDLQALEDLFVSTTTNGEHYFFGRSHPSALDCAVFGHLSQLLYITIDFPQQVYLKENCPGLLRFMEHFKRSQFPDWESLCEPKPNDGLRPDHPRVIAFNKKLNHLKLFAVAVSVGVGAIVYNTFLSN